MEVLPYFIISFLAICNHKRFFVNSEDPVVNESLINRGDFVPGAPFRFPFQTNSLSRVLDRNILSNLDENQEDDKQDKNCLKQFGLICKDCHTIMLCNNKITPQIIWKCPSSDPYCNDNVCSKEPPQGDAGEECLLSHFRCTSIGYFPDPTNCTQFFYCHSKEDSPMIYRCPPNYIYTPEGHKCKRRIFPSDCANLDCSRSKNSIAVYRHNRAYFGFCSESSPGNHEITMYKCPDDQNFQYDDVKKGCVFICRSEGIVPDRMDCTAFYTCYRRLFQLEWIHQRCPEGYYFKDNDCLQGSCNSELQ